MSCTLAMRALEGCLSASVRELQSRGHEAATWAAMRASQAFHAAFRPARRTFVDSARATASWPAVDEAATTSQASTDHFDAAHLEGELHDHRKFAVLMSLFRRRGHLIADLDPLSRGTRGPWKGPPAPIALKDQSARGRWAVTRCAGLLLRSCAVKCM